MPSIADDFRYLLGGKTGLGQQEGRDFGEEFRAMLTGQPLEQTPSPRGSPIRPEAGGPPAYGVDWDYEKDAWREEKEVALNIPQLSSEKGIDLWGALKNFLVKGFDVDRSVASGSSNVKDLLRGGEIHVGGADKYRAKRMKEQGL